MYREVTMIEVREVLRLRGAGLPKKRIAAQLGLDPGDGREATGGRCAASIVPPSSAGSRRASVSPRFASCSSGKGSTLLIPRCGRRSETGPVRRSEIRPV